MCCFLLRKTPVNFWDLTHTVARRYEKAGPAFGWGKRGPCPGRWLRGGAEKAITDQPHVNTQHCSMVISFANERIFLIWWYWLKPILMYSYFGVYTCIFTLCFMFIAADIVGCCLRHQDARCTHCFFNKLVAVTILQSFAFFFANFYVWGWGGPTVGFAPVVPWANTGSGRHDHILLSEQVGKSSSVLNGPHINSLTS
jgi:hypothetical protein